MSPPRPEHAPTALSLALARSSDAPRSAREFAHDAGAGWHLAAASAVLELAVSELVTNAVVHGQGSIRLKLIRRPREVIVEVYDGGAAEPTIQPSSATRFGGRGLRIVESVAEKWGVERSRDGKVVWCSIAC